MGKSSKKRYEQLIDRLQQFLGVSREEAKLVARLQQRGGKPEGKRDIRLEETDESLELLIYDPIGFSFWDDTVDAKSVVEQLSESRAPQLNVRINSPGGDVFDGLAIHNAIDRFEGSSKVFIDGLAASAASVVAMAGDEIEMALGSLMMIHDSWGLMVGNAQEAEEFAALLHRIDASAASIYANRTGQSVEAVRSMMDSETWFTSQEAVDAGFADGVGESSEGAGDSVAASNRRFNLDQFSNVPAKARETVHSDQGKKPFDRRALAAAAKARLAEIEGHSHERSLTVS